MKAALRRRQGRSRRTRRGLRCQPHGWTLRGREIVELLFEKVEEGVWIAPSNEGVEGESRSRYQASYGRGGMHYTNITSGVSDPDWDWNVKDRAICRYKNGEGGMPCRIVVRAGDLLCSWGKFAHAPLGILGKGVVNRPEFTGVN